MPRNSMDLLASILDDETAERTVIAESADVAVTDENKSNKKQKLGNNNDNNGQNGMNVAGTGASEVISTSTGIAGTSRNVPVPTVATGIDTSNDGGRRGADEKMDVDMETSAQTANSQASEATAKTSKIINPRTTTELVVKEIIASPEYRQLLAEKEQERLSAQPVVRKVAHRPPIPGLDVSTRTAPDTTASKDVVKKPNTAALPSNYKPEPKSKFSSASKSESIPISPSRSQAMSSATITTTTAATAPTPIPTGRARTSEYINRLYHLCATEGLETPVFDFETVAFAPVSLFKATLTIAGLIVGSDGVESASPIAGKKGGGVGLGASAALTAGTADCGTGSAKAGEKGAFKSKREAKEAAAEHGYLALTRFIDEGIIGRKASSQAGLRGERQKQQEGPKENWIGLLQGIVALSKYKFHLIVAIGFVLF